MPDPSSIEELILRLIRRERIANALARELGAEYAGVFQRIQEALRRIDPPGVSATRYRRERIAKLVEEVSKILREAGPAAEKLMRDRLAVIGRSEALATEAALIGTLGQEGVRAIRRTPITQARMRAILTTDPFQGRTLKEHVGRINADVLDRVRGQVRLGMLQEESITAIARRVRVAQGATERNAEALARTMVTGVSNVGMLETYAENANVVTGVRYTAALDDRTTEICLALDGTIWPAGSPDIVVPGLMTHYGCRSILVPELDYERFGLTPPPPEDRVVRDLSTIDDETLRRRVSERRGEAGFGRVQRISSAQSTDAWFRSQRRAVQDKLVGPRRAQMFRDGEIGSLRDLIRRDLSLVPLDELQR